MKKIKTGDKVQVIAGSYKGSVSVVEKVENDKVYVKGVNVRKKAVKKQGFMDKTMPIHISNVAIYSEKLQKPTKVGFQEKDGKKVRICKKTQEQI
ncbi:50S ribosomal protein L24 [Candidatus Absconditicoccus praedator]|uniref:50S ribosomal protein L24 n=1 Tax=Candidatus Absconditicoccus praedator TaxID=2735562 RepID=UPI001E654F21|nr:50S ribosomal protein L24 [Candidatus Absconditicoccus praedator]UFX82778.1 50S ribosomal protein L24 [Candidatus Absconditicoccus praedator]